MPNKKSAPEAEDSFEVFEQKAVDDGLIDSAQHFEERENIRAEVRAAAKKSAPAGDDTDGEGMPDQDQDDADGAEDADAADAADAEGDDAGAELDALFGVKDDEDGEEGADDEGAGADEGKAEKQHHKTAQDRIDELTYHRRSLQRENDELRRQLEEARRPGANHQQGQKQLVIEPKEELPPDPEKYPDGQFDSAYTRDLTAYMAKKAVSDAMRYREEQEAKRRQQDALSDEHKRLAAAAQQVMVYGETKYKDFRSILPVVQNWTLDDNVSAALLESPKAAEMVYYLAKKPAAAASFLSKSPRQQIMTLGSMEASLTKKAGVKLNKVPTRRVSPHGGGTSPDIANTQSFEAFERRAKRQSY